MARGENDTSNKIVKVRKGTRDDVVSYGDRGQRKGARARNAQAQGGMSRHMGGGVASFMLRSAIAEERGYARGPLTQRGEGRNTGITFINTPSARADLEKRPALGQAKPFGRTRMPGDGI